MPTALPGSRRNENAPHRGNFRPRRCDDGVFHFQDGPGPGKRRPRRRLRRLGEQLRQGAPRLERALQYRPLPDRLVDGRQRPAQKNRGRDHDARRHHAKDGEPCAESQHHRLQEQAQRPGDDRIGAAAIRCDDGFGERRVTQGLQALEHGAPHPQPTHRLAARARLFHEVPRLDRSLAHLGLQHEQRAGQHQEIDEGAEQADGEEQPLTLAQRRRDLAGTGGVPSPDRPRCHVLSPIAGSPERFPSGRCKAKREQPSGQIASTTSSTERV